MNKKKIAFVCYGGGHVNMLVPVLHALKSDFDFSCLALTTAKQVLDRENIPSLGFKNLMMKDDVRAKELGEKLAEGLQGSSVAHEESVAYLGLSYLDLENTIGEKEAAELYDDKGRSVFLPVATLKRFLLKEKPDLLVTTISPRAEEASIYAARDLGITSVCLVDLFARPSIRRASQKGYADKVCVISDNVKELMVEYGRSPDDIVVTGNPVFDQLFDKNLDSKASKLRERKGWGRKKVILWASQVEPEVSPINGQHGDPLLPQKIESVLTQIVQRQPDLHLLVRPHPNEGRDINKDILIDSVEFCESADPLNVLLKAVDVVVIMTSTIGYEAGLIGTPVISVDLSVFSGDTPYSELGLSKGVSSLDDLEKKLSECLGQQASVTESGAKSIAGNATKNVVDVIKNMLIG